MSPQMVAIHERVGFQTEWDRKTAKCQTPYCKLSYAPFHQEKPKEWIKITKHGEKKRKKEAQEAIIFGPIFRIYWPIGTYLLVLKFEIHKWQYLTCHEKFEGSKPKKSPS